MLLVIKASIDDEVFFFLQNVLRVVLICFRRRILVSRKYVKLHSHKVDSAIVGVKIQFDDARKQVES
jgi:hypothetical protein